MAALNGGSANMRNQSLTDFVIRLAKGAPGFGVGNGARRGLRLMAGPHAPRTGPIR